MLPVAMQERQGEDADEPPGAVWHQAPTAQVDVGRHLEDLHNPHQGHEDERDDEAAEKLPSFLFVVHAGRHIKNCSAAKVGNFGRLLYKKDWKSVDNDELSCFPTTYDDVNARIGFEGDVYLVLADAQYACGGEVVPAHDVEYSKIGFRGFFGFNIEVNKMLRVVVVNVRKLQLGTSGDKVAA